ncbi:MAG: hydroxyethylthiazole kinase [Bacteroidales bacterium]
MNYTAQSLWSDLQNIRGKAPLVHNITNFVVMNNTANALLAIGASPVMAHALQEMEEMTAIASALVLNIGTLSTSWVEAMVVAGKVASRRGIPIILDPVGAGATTYRTAVALSLLKEVKPAIVRGNGSEIAALLNASPGTKGVDSTISSLSAIDAARSLACEYGTIVSVSGPSDFITNGKQVIEVKNGHPLMAKVTGLGCTASALTGAFAAVQPDPFAAAIHAMLTMGIAGEVAASRANGPGSLQVEFLDTLFQMDAETVASHLKVSNYEAY